MEDSTAMEEGTAFMVLSFPRDWPPKMQTELHSLVQDGVRAVLSGDVHGRLVVLATFSDGTQSTCTSHPLVVRGDRRAIIAYSWAKTACRIHINGLTDAVDRPGTPPLIVGGNSEPIPPIALPGTPAGLSDEDRLFLDTLRDLAEKTESGTEYNLLRAAGLLRQLLIDGSPLVTVVNRNHRIILSFTVVARDSDPPLNPVWHWISVDPLVIGVRSEAVSLQGLLGVPCLKTDTSTVAVADVIRLAANASGGVHFGSPKTDEEKELAGWDSVVRVTGAKPSLMGIAEICRVVLRGLAPLAWKVVGRDQPIYPGKPVSPNGGNPPMPR